MLTKDAVTTAKSYSEHVNNITLFFGTITLAHKNTLFIFYN